MRKSKMDLRTWTVVENENKEHVYAVQPLLQAHTESRPSKQATIHLRCLLNKGLCTASASHDVLLLCTVQLKSSVAPIPTGGAGCLVDKILRASSFLMSALNSNSYDRRHLSKHTETLVYAQHQAVPGLNNPLQQMNSDLLRISRIT